MVEGGEGGGSDSNRDRRRVIRRAGPSESRNSDSVHGSGGASTRSSGRSSVEWGCRSETRGSSGGGGAEKGADVVSVKSSCFDGTGSRWSDGGMGKSGSGGGGGASASSGGVVCAEVLR